MPVYELGEDRPSVPEDCWLAPDAQVVGKVFLAGGVNVWFGAAIRGDLAPIHIGRDTNIQDGCVLHVDEDFPLRIGERVTVGHGALLHGCTLEDEVLVGMGATVLNGAHVGQGSLIGAGALLREGERIPPFSLVLGVPATVRRSLPEDETLRSHLEAAAGYVEQSRRYRRLLKKRGDV